MLTKDKKKAIKNLKNKISNKYTLVDFILYGSKASGRDTDESDIDIMVEVEEEGPMDKSPIYKRIVTEGIRI